MISLMDCRGSVVWPACMLPPKQQKDVHISVISRRYERPVRLPLCQRSRYAAVILRGRRTRPPDFSKMPACCKIPFLTSIQSQLKGLVATASSSSTTCSACNAFSGVPIPGGTAGIWSVLLMSAIVHPTRNVLIALSIAEIEQKCKRAESGNQGRGGVL